MSEPLGQSPCIAGLVLAAGRSRRMGVLKQTLPWPMMSSALAKESTIVASAFDAIAPQCERMFVVVGRDADAVIEALGGRVFTRIEADSEVEMFASVRAGLRVISESSESNQRFGAVLLQPGDHPGVTARTIAALFDEHGKDPTRAIMPEHRGKGGHPALIPIDIARMIVAWELNSGGGGGLRQFWMDHANLRTRIAVEDPWCTVDLDTPADYESAHRAALAACKRSSSDF